MSIRVYDPTKVTITVNRLLIGGFAKDSMITVKKNEDNSIPYVGVHGEVSFAKNADKTGVISLELASTSPSLAYMTELARAGEPFPVSLVDMNENGQNVSDESCFILKEPDISRNKEVESVTIEIYVPYLYQ